MDRANDADGVEEGGAEDAGWVVHPLVDACENGGEDAAGAKGGGVGDRFGGQAVDEAGKRLEVGVLDPCLKHHVECHDDKDRVDDDCFRAKGEWEGRGGRVEGAGEVKGGLDKGAVRAPKRVVVFVPWGLCADEVLPPGFAKDAVAGTVAVGFPDEAWSPGAGADLGRTRQRVTCESEQEVDVEAGKGRGKDACPGEDACEGLEADVVADKAVVLLV